MSSGRRQISSGSLGSSSTSRHLNQGRIKCTCGLDAVIRTVKQGHNIGSKFYGCPKWPDTQCNFLKWVDLNNDVDALRFKLFEKDTIISELEMQKEMLEEKVKKLQLKKGNFEEDVQEMKSEVSQLRIELMKSARNERNFSMALLFSWVFFAVMVFYSK